MRLILSDLPEGTLADTGENARLFTAREDSKTCRGCFNCWTKTPGRCVIKDEVSEIPALFGVSDEIIIISRCWCGCYSPAMKTMVDRLIPAVLPFFEMVNGEMHHQRRYPKSPRLTVLFYHAEEGDQPIAEELVEANAENMRVDDYSVRFLATVGDIKEAISCA